MLTAKKFNQYFPNATIFNCVWRDTN